MSRIVFLLLILFFSCKRDDVSALKSVPIKVEGFPDALLNPNNLTTEQGVSLGKMLFYDPILSVDSTQSCASCHQQQHSFVDENKALSIGVAGIAGERNASALINLAWNKNFFWDGRNKTLEEQALGPVINPLEMNEKWENVIKKLEAHPTYPSLFYQAFNEKKGITKELVAAAIAQFERTLISANSKFDQYYAGKITLSESEQLGKDLFFSEKAECFHCHGVPLFTDNLPHNNGLDSVHKDLGYQMVSGQSKDEGKFITPTLRNIEFTAPYMHDGRFNTLEEVIDFYSDGVQYHPTVDPLIKHAKAGGFQFTEQEKKALVAFLKTLSDREFLKNSNFKKPNFYIIPIK